MKLTKAILGVAAGAMLTTGFALQAQAEDKLFVPLLTYRTGPFAGSGTPNANGMHDLFTMLNVRDGGIGGAKIVVNENVAIRFDARLYGSRTDVYDSGWWCGVFNCGVVSVSQTMWQGDLTAGFAIGF